MLKKQEINAAFVREAEHLHRLRHPLVVPLLAIFYSSKNTGCILMPYYEHGNLRSWFDECRGRVEEATRVRSRMHEVSRRD